MFKNIAAKNGMRQLLLMAVVAIFVFGSSCAGSKSTQTNKHRKPVSTGKRKCGCSMLSPDTNRIIKLYQQTYYVLQA